ncbi:hypothetical protein [Kordia sp.]|uniref:hypothetical protein n=1 Tax=Kordia sp. TaxID=1965332 RepID=UPI003D28242C
MLFNNYKAAISILHHLLGENNFAITGSLADYKHLGEDILINDIDIIIVNEEILENLNPYFKLKKNKEINYPSIPHIKRVYVYNILNIKIEIFLNEKFNEIEKSFFSGLSINFVNIIGRKKELLNFIDLSKKQKDAVRIVKYTKKLKRYNLIK